MKAGRQEIVMPRETLLIEIDRHCAYPDCNDRVFIGLTKREALSYRGFECTRCKRWNDDNLAERDVPEWWTEIKQESLS